MKYPTWEMLPVGFLLGLCLLTGCPEAPTQPPPVTNVEWETISPPPGGYTTARTQVPGGWLVIVGWRDPSATFVPDPAHAWLKPKPEAEDILKLYVAADRVIYEALEPLLDTGQNDKLVELLHLWQARIEAAESSK